MQLEAFLRGSVPQLIKRDTSVFVFNGSIKCDTTGNEGGNSIKHGQIPIPTNIHTMISKELIEDNKGDNQSKKGERNAFWLDVIWLPPQPNPI